MRNPIYTIVALMSCGYLAMANINGWALLGAGLSRSALNSTSYRYRPSHASSGWSFGGFHK
ncbi:MAG: hypothetical protein V4662_00215 [Verrucomicrobiota bacterium]